ncbi:PEP-CTERM sorting domain-containing protein [Desulfobacter latus]
MIITGDLNNPVPEPTTILLFGFGLLGLARVSRRKE